MTPQQILRAYARRYSDEAAMATKSLELLGEGECLARSCFPAHVTASMIIPQGDSLLTVWHPYLQQWLQPGGHVDPGEDPLSAVLREAREETGFDCVLDQDDGMPWDIDCLFVPVNPKKGVPDHLHIDFRYRLRPVAMLVEAELPTACIP